MQWIGYNLQPEWIPNEDIEDILDNSELKLILIHAIKQHLVNSLNPNVSLNIVLSNKWETEAKRHLKATSKWTYPSRNGLDKYFGMSWNIRTIKSGDRYEVVDNTFKVKFRKKNRVLDGQKFFHGPNTLIIKFVRQFISSQHASVSDNEI